MKITVEVCIDNIESLSTAIEAGALRIELCSALAQGGLTPSIGFVRRTIQKLASRNLNIPIHPIIRHRAGDFVFDDDEIDIMVEDIKAVKAMGVSGVVVGALTEQGLINEAALARFMDAAGVMSVTFHRAFDLCNDPFVAMDILVKYGCERILTSGQQASVEEGIELIAQLVKRANGRISIMPGAGVNVTNARYIVEQTGAREIHLSGKTTRSGRMHSQNGISMGIPVKDDSAVSVTGFEQVYSVVQSLEFG